MKLYKIEREEFTSKDGESHTPLITKFEGTQADARKARMNLEEAFKALKPKDRPNVKVVELDVPTDKKGLIEFLNKLVE